MPIDVESIMINAVPNSKTNIFVKMDEAEIFGQPAYQPSPTDIIGVPIFYKNNHGVPRNIVLVFPDDYDSHEIYQKVCIGIKERMEELASTLRAEGIEYRGLDILLKVLTDPQNSDGTVGVEFSDRRYVVDIPDVDDLEISEMETKSCMSNEGLPRGLSEDDAEIQRNFLIGAPEKLPDEEDFRKFVEEYLTRAVK